MEKIKQMTIPTCPMNTTFKCLFLFASASSSASSLAAFSWAAFSLAILIQQTREIIQSSTRQHDHRKMRNKRVYKNLSLGYALDGEFPDHDPRELKPPMSSKKKKHHQRGIPHKFNYLLGKVKQKERSINLVAHQGQALILEPHLSGLQRKDKYQVLESALNLMTA